MALDSLIWFTKLAERGSFTKAAENLEITQQTLSARLAALEKEVGAKLVQRGTPLSLTPAGMAFLVYAQEQQQAQEDLLRQIADVSNGGAGILKIGITPMRGRTVMPPVIDALLETLPDLRFTFMEGTNREVIRMAERGEVDAIVARFGNSHPGINVTPLYQEEVVLVIDETLLTQVTGQDTAAAQELIAEKGLRVLAECPFVLGSVDDITGRIAYSELRNAGIRSHAIVNTESLSTQLTMAIHGIGAAFSPKIMLDATSAKTSNLVRIPLSDQAKYTISLGIPTKTTPWRSLEEFKRTIIATTSENETLAPCLKNQQNLSLTEGL